MEGTLEEGDINKCEWGWGGGQLIGSAVLPEGNKELK